MPWDHTPSKHHQALAQLSATVDLQATVLGYVHTFWLMSVAFACLIPLVSLLQKPSKDDETAAAKAH